MKVKAAIVAAASLVWTGAMQSAPLVIDTQRSTLTIHVGKSGAFSAFGHNHEIQARIASGTVETGEHPFVELHINARGLSVTDAEASEKDRGEIQKTMLGPEVLDCEKYPEIIFRSASAERNGTERWTLRGDLTLHGQTHPVTIDVLLKAGHYVGQATLKQTDFGIQPIRVAGGAVKVKDEIKIEFDVALVS